jgi:hypothetical protein
MNEGTRLQSPAFPRNRDPILGVLRERWGGLAAGRILELASGPGEHACYFAQALPALTWQPTEPQAEGRASIDAWRRALGLEARVLAPLRLEVGVDPWPAGPFDGALAINFLHMVGIEAVGAALQGVGAALAEGAELIVYDCFSYGGAHVSESNVAFDRYLRQSTPAGRVHAFEEVDALALAAGLVEPQIYHLPANNQGVVWTRR